MNPTDAFQYARQRVTRCALCRRPAVHLGAFFPTDPALWPGPPLQAGKVRAFFYGLCKRCGRRPDKMVAVEAALLTFGASSSQTELC